MTAAAPTCADDVSLIADTPSLLQTLVSIVENYSIRHHYQLQPTKSVILLISTKAKSKPLQTEVPFNISIQQEDHSSGNYPSY